MYILNHMLIKIHCSLHSTNTHDTSYKNETNIFGKKRKKFCFIYEYCPRRQVFNWKQKHTGLCECSQMFLHLENDHKEVAALFLLVNCITYIWLHQHFISIFGVFLLINPKSNIIILEVADYDSKDFWLLKK